MQLRTAWTLLAAVLLTAGTALGEDGEAEPVAQAQGPVVGMDLSFRIPGGKGISHTPAVVFTKDGKRMVTATSDGKLVVFAAEDRRLLKEIALPEKGSNGVSIDPAGKYAAWTLADKGLVVIDLATGKEIARDAEFKAEWVAVSPDAKTVAVTSIEIRDLKTLKRVGHALAAPSAVTNVAWNADGSRLAYTTASGHVEIRDTKTRKHVFEAKKSVAMHALAFDPTGKYFAFGGQDNQVYQVDLATKDETVISKNQPFWITCLGYSPDGQRIAVGDESCDIWLYDIEPAQLTFHNKHHVECWLSEVAWAPDNETFLFGCRPNTHAGRPSLHAPLQMAEASRSDAARATRAGLLAALDAEIKKEKDDTRRTSLSLYRDSLVGEETVGMYGWSGYGGSFGAGAAGPTTGGGEIVFDGGAAETVTATGGTFDGGGGAGGKGRAGASAPPDLPANVQKLLDAHQKTLTDEAKKVAADFCVNQWKVTPPTEKEPEKTPVEKKPAEK